MAVKNARPAVVQHLFKTMDNHNARSAFPGTGEVIDYIVALEASVTELAAIIQSDVEVPATMREINAVKERKEWQDFLAERDGSRGTKPTGLPTQKASSAAGARLRGALLSQVMNALIRRKLSQTRK